MIDLWPRLEPLLARVERPARYLDHEWGSTRKEGADFNYCMVYPDTYELGQPNQAVRILVNAVNATEHLAAERAFLPAVDLIDLMREEGIPMFSLESCASLSGFDAIGITLPHELAATNVLEVLDLDELFLEVHNRERLCQEAVNINFQRLCLNFGPVVGRQEQHGRIDRDDLPDLARRIQAVHARHLPVENDGAVFIVLCIYSRLTSSTAVSPL